MGKVLHTPFRGTGQTVSSRCDAIEYLGSPATRGFDHRCFMGLRGLSPVTAASA